MARAQPFQTSTLHTPHSTLTLNPPASTLNSSPSTSNLNPCPQPSTLNPQPSLNPRPSTLTSMFCGPRQPSVAGLGGAAIAVCGVALLCLFKA
eukprot:1454079-Rhodomonas_salina.3